MEKEGDALLNMINRELFLDELTPLSKHLASERLFNVFEERLLYVHHGSIFKIKK